MTKIKKHIFAIGIAIGCFAGSCQLKAQAPPTYGFTQQSASVIYQWPYTLNLSDRHTGTFPGLEHFWVYNTDPPFQQGSSTNPRTEAELSPQWTSGVWQFEGDLKVPSGTTEVNVMQVFGADPTIGSTTFMLRCRQNGDLWAYNVTALIRGTWDQWHHLNVIHDDNAHTVQIYIDYVPVYTVNDNDNGTHPTHYFKYGVYQTGNGSSHLTESYWQNVKVWYAAVAPTMPIHPVVLVGTNGAMSAYAIFSDGSVNTTWQSTAGGTWSSWASLGGSGLTALSGVVLPNGCMALYTCGGGAVWATWQTNVGGLWQPWVSLGGNGFTQVKALAFSDSRMAVVGCGNGTAINYDAQNAPGGTWTGWSAIGSAASFTALDAVILSNQTVSAFGCGGQAVYTAWQSTTNGSFSDWNSVGGNGFTQIKALTFSDGHMALIGCGDGTAVNYQAQPQAGGAWPGWTSLSGSGFSSIDGVINDSQNVSIFGCGGNAVYTAWQSTPGGNFSNWTSLGGNGFYTVAGIILPTGAMTAFGGAAGTPLWTIWQNSDGGTWSNWTSLGGTLR